MALPVVHQNAAIGGLHRGVADCHRADDIRNDSFVSVEGGSAFLTPNCGYTFTNQVRTASRNSIRGLAVVPPDERKRIRKDRPTSRYKSGIEGEIWQ